QVLANRAAEVVQNQPAAADGEDEAAEDEHGEDRHLRCPARRRLLRLARRFGHPCFAPAKRRSIQRASPQSTPAMNVRTPAMNPIAPTLASALSLFMLRFPRNSAQPPKARMNPPSSSIRMARLRDARGASCGPAADGSVMSSPLESSGGHHGGNRREPQPMPTGATTARAGRALPA